MSGPYARAMSRVPLWRRLLDLVALLACVLGATGAAFSAVDADHWPSRVVSAGIAVALGVLVLRGTSMVWREWRSASGSTS